MIYLSFSRVLAMARVMLGAPGVRRCSEKGYRLMLINALRLLNEVRAREGFLCGERNGDANK